MYIERLNNILSDTNISITDLSSKLGIERSVLGKYLSGYLVIPLIHLNSLCNYFNLSFDYIFGFNDVNYPVDSKNINKKVFSLRLKEFRVKNKLNQKDIAKALNCFPSTISDYERNIRMITTSHLYSFCSKYKISADYLLGKKN